MSGHSVKGLNAKDECQRNGTLSCRLPRICSNFKCITLTTRCQQQTCHKANFGVSQSEATEMQCKVETLGNKVRLQ